MRKAIFPSDMGVSLDLAIVAYEKRKCALESDSVGLEAKSDVPATISENVLFDDTI